MSDKLKACPFCGVSGEVSNCNSFLYIFDHKKDCILGNIVTIDSRSTDAKSWNTRPEPEEYKEYEFCKDTGCQQLLFIGDDDCIIGVDEHLCLRSIPQFERWLKQNNYKIVKGGEKKTL